MKKSLGDSMLILKKENVYVMKATIGARILKLLVILIFIESNMNSLSSQVLISSGSGTPDNTAMLEVKSTSKGFLPPA